MSRSPRHATRALTLLEVIISIALIVMLLGAMMTFFWQTVTIRDHAVRIADRTQIVQQVLERMAAELRDCVGIEQVGFPVTQFVGERRRITFLTAPLPPAHSYAFFRESEEPPLPAHDLREITYELWVDPEETTEEGEPLVAGIIRTERRAIEPSKNEEEVAEDEDLLYLRHDLWSHELGYLEFRYFDGVEWTTGWQVNQGNPLPHAVQITVGFDSLTSEELEDQDLEEFPLEQYPLGPDVPNLDRYSLIVRIPAVDQMFAGRMNRLGAEIEELFQFMGPPGTEGMGELGGEGGFEPGGEGVDQ